MENPCQCWVCGGIKLHLVKKGNLPDQINSQNFSITDSHYGVTADIYKCEDCGFMQCANIPDVLGYYEDLEDQDYEKNRAERLLQAKSILSKIRNAYNVRQYDKLTLLDVGAGSGVLVEQAIKMGFNAEGIEPSRWLHGVAINHGLHVHQGILPHPNITGKYDVITVIDVIEHIGNPAEMLQLCKDLLNDNGIIVVVTPDAGSIMARVMRRKWWHYRIAHIGYFTDSSLRRLCKNVQLDVLKRYRPGWVFTMAYLFERVMQYVPERIRVSSTGWMENIKIPLNLMDSLMFILRK